MKLDLGQAWSDATALLSANKDVIGIVAGVFFFLPSLAFALLLPDAAQPQIDPANSDAVMEAMLAIYADNWWIFVLISVLQMIGLLSLFALLKDSARPTVSEALKRGATGLPSYIVAQIITVIALGAIAGILAVISPFLVFLAFPVVIYVMIKLSLVGPVIAVEQTLNPFTALVRSWVLTKGNSLRIFAFFVLLFVIAIVILLLITLIAGVILAAVGGQIELIGNGLVSSLLGAAMTAIYAAVLASIHRFLAGPDADALSKTFD